VARVLDLFDLGVDIPPWEEQGTAPPARAAAEQSTSIGKADQRGENATDDLIGSLIAEFDACLPNDLSTVLRPVARVAIAAKRNALVSRWSGECTAADGDGGGVTMLRLR